jgi:hypothetical protein
LLAQSDEELAGLAGVQSVLLFEVAAAPNQRLLWLVCVCACGLICVCHDWVSEGVAEVI